MTAFGIGESLAVAQLLELPKTLKTFYILLKRFRHTKAESNKIRRQCLREYRLVNTTMYNIINMTKNSRSVPRKWRQGIRDVTKEAHKVFLALKKKLDQIMLRNDWTLRAKWAFGKSYCVKTLEELRGLSSELTRHADAATLYCKQKKATTTNPIAIGAGVGIIGGVVLGAVIGAKCCSAGGVTGVIVGGVVGGVLGTLVGWFWS